jgi:hypothetical protein
MGYGKVNPKNTKSKIGNLNKRGSIEVCPAWQHKTSCDWCLRANELRRSDDPDDKELYMKIRSQGKFYMTIFDLNNPSAGRQLFASGISILKGMSEYLPDDGYDNDDDAIDFMSLTAPHAVIITKTGSGLSTEYGVRVSPAPTKYPKSELKKAPINLDKIVELVDTKLYPFWKPQDGKNKILVFPPWSPEADDFFKEFRFHYIPEGFALDDEGGSTAEEEDDIPEFDDEYNEETPFVDDDKEEPNDNVEMPNFDGMSPTDLREFIDQEELEVDKTLKGSKLRKAVISEWVSQNEE